MRWNLTWLVNSGRPLNFAILRFESIVVAIVDVATDVVIVGTARFVTSLFFFFFFFPADVFPSHAPSRVPLRPASFSQARFTSGYSAAPRTCARSSRRRAL